MKKVSKMLMVISFLFAFNSLVFADMDNYNNDSMMNQDMMNSENVSGSNCVAKYNFLTGILNLPCVDVGGEIYWINLKLNQEGSDKISLELVDAGKNTDYDTENMNDNDMMDNNDTMNDNDMMDNGNMDNMDNNETMMNNNMMDNH